MPITNDENACLRQTARELRHDIISTTVWAGGGHVGGALSVIDIMTILYFKYLRIDPANPNWEKRDRMVLSKGHAGLAYAPTLAKRGYFDRDLLKTFNRFKSPFGMHLDCRKARGVDISTGSLGHGLPIAVGLAAGARYQNQDWKTFCIVGDGECNEGSIWEAAMAAAQWKLTNLITIVDRNMLMIDGPTEKVMGLEPFADKWEAFGFIPKEVDGHDFFALADALDFALQDHGQPVVIIARTVKGKGVDFMENDFRWHYGSFDEVLVQKARFSIDKLYE